MSVWVMLSTAETLREAKRIAARLVVEKLAACVTVLPAALSFFYWEGKVCRQKETVLVAKTTRKNAAKMMKKIKEIHSYQIPEILFFGAVKGEKGYLEWVAKSTERK